MRSLNIYTCTSNIGAVYDSLPVADPLGDQSGTLKKIGGVLSCFIIGQKARAAR